MTAPARSLARRLVPYWAVFVTVGYLWSQKVWVRLDTGVRIIMSSLPFPAAIAPPRIWFFLANAAGFLGSLAAIGCAGAGVGTAAARWLRLRPGSAGRDLALGWGLLANLLLGLGLVGCWFAPVMAAFAVPCAAWGAVALIRRRAWRTGWGPFWRVRAFSFPAVLLGWLLLLICLAPESFQDAMRYHLFLPRQFLLEHKFFHVDRYLFWSYMGLQHMLNAAALSLGGDPAGRAVNVALGLAGLFTVARIGRLAGLATDDLGLALGLVVAAPGLMLITGSAFGEHGCALFVLLSVEAILGSGSRSGRLREAALLMSLAFSAKYTALFGLAGLILLVAVGDDRVAWWRALTGRAASLAVIVFVPLAGWVAERWVWTGDPVSPYLAKFGVHTLDSSSAIELHAYYRFVGESQEGFIANPSRALWDPLGFAGAHGGFWEHPGPAITVLALPAILYLFELPTSVLKLVSFAAGSAGLWGLLFGGVSPHYVMGLAGVWVAGLIGVLPVLPARHALIVRNTLCFGAFTVGLLSFGAGTFRFGPRDVAFGMVSRDYYLNGLAPRGVYLPVRRDLEAAAPGRGTVYVLGDDTSYYLSGRVFCDYEDGSDPLLWRIARDSPGARRIRVRLRQRGFTHMIYSTRWPDELAGAKVARMRFAPPVALRFQEFWREYAAPVAIRERDSRDEVVGGYAFAFLREPRAGPYDARFSRRMPFMPGAGVLTWAGDRRLQEGRPAEAAAAYGKWTKGYGGLAVVQDRLARVAALAGRPSEAAAHVRAARAVGWLVPDPARRR